MGQDMDPTNPYDPPDRQVLEEQLYHDQQLQAADHQALDAIHHVQDAATAAGMDHAKDDQRAADYALNEQTDSARVTRDGQNIDNWDRSHPGWENHLDQYQPSADAASPADTSGDVDSSGYADPGYADATDPYAAEDQGSTDVAS
jgi:hypothetical protein